MAGNCTGDPRGGAACAGIPRPLLTDRKAPSIAEWTGLSSLSVSHTEDERCQALLTIGGIFPLRTLKKAPNLPQICAKATRW